MILFTPAFYKTTIQCYIVSVLAQKMS